MFNLMFRVWSFVVFWARIATLLFVGVVVLLGYLSDQGEVEISPGLEKLAWKVTLVVIAVESVGTLISRKYFKSKGVKSRDLEKSLMALLILMSKDKRVRFEELGACVYEPEYWRNTWLLRIVMRSKKTYLKRVKRFRPAGFPPPSGLTWTDSTGTVGDCWTEKRTKHHNTSAITKRYGGNGEVADEKSFSEADSRIQQGFSWADFRSIGDKYAEVLATPIWDHRKERSIIGVLTVDRAMLPGDDGLKSYLSAMKTREYIEITARQLGTQLRQREEGD